jgi:hypothetical protein
VDSLLLPLASKNLLQRTLIEKPNAEHSDPEKLIFDGAELLGQIFRVAKHPEEMNEKFMMNKSVQRFLDLVNSEGAGL